MDAFVNKNRYPWSNEMLRDLYKSTDDYCEQWLSKGDTPGHEFHGNQYGFGGTSDASQKANAASKELRASSTAEGHQQAADLHTAAAEEASAAGDSRGTEYHQGASDFHSKEAFKLSEKPNLDSAAKDIKFPKGKNTSITSGSYTWTKHGGYADAVIRNVSHAAGSAGFTSSHVSTNSPDGSYMGGVTTYRRGNQELTISSNYGPTAANNYHSITLRTVGPKKAAGGDLEKGGPGSGPHPGAGKQIDPAAYHKSPAKQRTAVLKSQLASHKDKYVPQDKIEEQMRGLSKEGKASFYLKNKEVGKLEGIGRAMANKGWNTSDKEQRKYFHFAINCWDKAAATHESMKEIK